MKKYLVNGVGTLVLIAVFVSFGAVFCACYPNACNPRTDPLKCQCPSGVCGDYPTAKKDGGQ